MENKEETGFYDFNEVKVRICPNRTLSIVQEWELDTVFYEHHLCLQQEIRVQNTFDTVPIEPVGFSCLDSLIKELQEIRKKICQ